MYACSKCFTRHPYEELSSGQQLCKKCRGDFPVVKCTYCRSEFQQENKNKTSSICKRCDQCVAQYGKPTSCQFCQLPAAFVSGKCQRCSHYNKRYGPPKICEQCKQKSAFDKGDNSKLMCWACSCSYKRALAKTKQSDPARHSRVFKKEKKALSEEDIQKKRERYMNSKKPNRPDVTKIEGENTHTTTSSNKPVVPAKKEPRTAGDSDHVGEITQLKEKISLLEKTVRQKDNQMISKDKDITQMKAKLFNEEKLIRMKMQKMALVHDDKVAELSSKIRALQNEISKLRKDSKVPTKGARKQDNLFKDSKKRTISRTNSPAPQRSRSRSPPADNKSRSQSPTAAPTVEAAATEAVTADKRSRSRSPVANNSSGANSVRSSPSRSPSPAAKQARLESPVPLANNQEDDGAAVATTTTDNDNGEREVEDVEMTETEKTDDQQNEESENLRNSRSPSPSPSANGGEGVDRGGGDVSGESGGEGGAESGGEGGADSAGEEGEVHEDNSNSGDE